MAERIQFLRRQMYNRAREEFIDEPIPTNPARIFGVGRSTHSKDVGSPWNIGSYYIGTEQTLQIVFEEFSTNTPNVYFQIRHDNVGTIETPYLEAAGQETRIGGISEPLESIGTSGYLRVDALGPNIAGAFKGIGSVGNVTVGAKVVGYFI